MIIYLVLMTLKPHVGRPFELVIDFTHASVENRLRVSFWVELKGYMDLSSLLTDALLITQHYM